MKRRAGRLGNEDRKLCFDGGRDQGREIQFIEEISDGAEEPGAVRDFPRRVVGRRPTFFHEVRRRLPFHELLDGIADCGQVWVLGTARMRRDERRVHRFEISQEGFEGQRIGRERFAQPGRGGRDFPELAEFIEGGHWVMLLA